MKAHAARGAGRRCRTNHPAAAPRTYHLVDLENHLGDTAWDTAAVTRLADQYHDLVQPGADDLTFVVVGPRLACAAKAAFPGAELKVAEGPDAADLKLIFHESRAEADEVLVIPEPAALDLTAEETWRTLPALSELR